MKALRKLAISQASLWLIAAAEVRDHPTTVLIGYRSDCGAGEVFKAAHVAAAATNSTAAAALLQLAAPSPAGRLAGRSGGAESTRDEVLKTLYILTQTNIRGAEPPTLSAQLEGGEWRKLSKNYLDELAIDVIAEPSGNVSSHRLARLASTLPCLSFAPHPDRIRAAKDFFKTDTPASGAKAVTPNDPLFNKQWSLTATNVNKAWTKVTGEGVNVAVIDSGCSFHPDLAANLWVDPTNPKCKDANQDNPVPYQNCHGYDFGEGISPHYVHGDHGTTVAGFIAGVTDNHYGLSGVCWNCKVACLKTDNANKEILTSALVATYNWIIKRGDTFKISNHSYGEYWPPTAAEKLGVQRLLAMKNHIMVVAAGNEGCDIDATPGTPEWTCKEEGELTTYKPWPQTYDDPNMVVVGSNDINMMMSDWSCYGAKSVDLFAPGDQVWGLANGFNKTTHLPSLVTDLTEGTSFSAPFTAGALALIWSGNPTFSRAQVIDKLMRTAHREAWLAGKSVVPGVVDEYKAVADLPDHKTPKARNPPKKDLRYKFYFPGGASNRLSSPRVIVMLMAALMALYFF